MFYLLLENNSLSHNFLSDIRHILYKSDDLRAIPLTAKYKTAMIAVITTAISIAEPNFFGNFTFFSRYSITRVCYH